MSQPSADVGPSSDASQPDAACAVYDHDRTAEDRDDIAEAHDRAPEARDERADARDERAERREEDGVGFDPGAAADRAGAKRDRQGGAGDRLHAENDREAAAADRSLSARDRDRFLVDALTGAHRRDAGVLELEREIVQAKRTERSFVLVFVDVDGLKERNDSVGHLAGDLLLSDVVDSVREHTRAYDLIVRYGGDEFLCGLADMTEKQVADRFARVSADLAARQAAISIGIAQLRPTDRLQDLIERADGALYADRRLRRASPPLQS